MVVLWVLVFVVVVAFGIGLFPFDSMCNPPGNTSVADDLNCRFLWSILVLLLGAGLAAGAVVMIEKWSSARYSSRSEDPPRP
jgi:hypothetical protein